VFECVINISEGRNLDVIDDLHESAGASVRDVHADPFHNRSVFTLINSPEALIRDVRNLIAAAFQSLDLRAHEGVHPRFGVVDVVPFVALEPETPSRAVDLRDDTARWIAETFDVPVFLYGLLDGGVRTLPEVRRHAFAELSPDFGPGAGSARLGAVAVGERPILVAWNIWLSGVSRDATRAMAKAVRRDEVRSLALRAGEHMQVSCNLIDPMVVGPGAVYDEVAAMLPPGGEIVRAELVGLVPRAVLVAEERRRWGELGLGEDLTIEGRLGQLA
jgi:glutamate formiminotransferase / 5-formyltetrahydrofolate cyclo-ligase